MADPDEYLEVGRIGKAHGVGGELLVTFISDRDEVHAKGSVLRTVDGDFTVTSSRPHQGKRLLRFDGVNSRNQAEELRGMLVSAPPPPPTDDELWAHNLIGCGVIDADGTDRGTIAEIQANPASDLLVLSDGALIPAVFITDGPTEGIVSVDTPTGLFSINELED